MTSAINYQRFIFKAKISIMKRIFKTALFVFCASLFMFGWCSKDKTTAPNNSVTAKIGSSQFSSSGNDVVVNISSNPVNTSENELTITAESGSQLLTIAVANYTNATGTFHFDTGEALGGYSNGGSSDDVIVSGTLVITEADNTIAGTFSGTTLAGTTISNGTFSVQK